MNIFVFLLLVIGIPLVSCFLALAIVGELKWRTFFVTLVIWLTLLAPSTVYVCSVNFKYKESKIIQTNDLSKYGIKNVEVDGLQKIRVDTYIRKGFLINDKKEEWTLIIGEEE